jgi:branched-chain amino acid transport system substrate-binding protein
MEKNLKQVIAFSLILLGFLANSGTGLAAEPYNIGIALAFTGSGALYSKEGAEGMKLAIEEINAQGGFLKKHPINVSIRDTQSKPDASVRETKDLILRDKVRCILGPYSSSEAVAMKPICAEYKVLHITACANSENIGRLNFSPYTFLVVPNTYQQAKASALYIADMTKKKGWKEYVTIAADYEWGRSGQENTVQLLKEAVPDLKLKKEFWPPLGETQFTSYITAIMAQKPDFVVSVLTSKDNVAWMKQAQAYGFFDKIPYFGGLLTLTELKILAKEIPRGVIGICRGPFYAHMNVPMMANFVKNYQAKYGEYPSDWAVMGYDAVYALKQGIEKARSIDTEKVSKAMSGMNINTCRGQLSFRKIDNQLNCPSYLGVVGDDPKYPFPILKDLLVFSGTDSSRPEAEILDARSKEKK